MAVTVQKYETADNNLLEKCGHGYKLITGHLSFATYITGGVPMDMSLDFPARVDLVVVESVGGYVFSYDYGNRTLKAYDGTQDEVAGNFDLATNVSNTHFMVIGK